jgi:hypothetical protein
VLSGRGRRNGQGSLLETRGIEAVRFVGRGDGDGNGTLRLYPLLVCLDRWFYRVCVNLCDEHIHSKVFHVCPLNKRTGMSQRIQVIRIGLGLVERGAAREPLISGAGNGKMPFVLSRVRANITKVFGWIL